MRYCEGNMTDITSSIINSLLIIECLIIYKVNCSAILNLFY